MQYKDIAILKKASTRTTIANAIKAIIFIGVLVFIYLKIEENPRKFGQVIKLLYSFLQPNGLLIFWGLIGLTAANWILEGFKWQLLVKKVERISLGNSVQSVLLGLSMGFITPHALGDYAGRIWQLKAEKRVESLGAIMLGRAAQYFATFSFGLFGISYLLFDTNSAEIFSVISLSLVTLSIVTGGALFLFFRTRFLRILDFKKLRQFRKYFAIVGQYSHQEIIFLLGLAFTRYLIFALQFYLLLSFFGVSTDHILLIAGVTWTLFAKSSIPSFNFLSDLGIREFSALYFFSYYSVDNTLVLLASFTLWCLNLLIPALIGLAGVVRMKIFTTP